MNYNLEIKAIDDLRVAAAFISKCNSTSHQHVGYCGENEEEILHTLEYDFSELPLAESLIGAFHHDQLVGVLGLDIEKDSQEAEIWGPFIQWDDWLDVAHKMWDGLIKKLSSPVQQYNGFYHKDHQYAAPFMDQLQFEKGNAHYILIAKPSSDDPLCEEGIQEITSDLFPTFITLHQELFPHTYYNGEDIIQRLNEERKVLISKDNEELQGYVYFEANPEFHEGSLEYIGVSQDHRKKGVGKRLIRSALFQLFNHFSIEEIQLCVAAENEKALKLYKSAGFLVKNKLISYRRKEI
ncbi:GNAT family N-acetyltransferase [Heyndrickxia oleronia]|uniref:GNAT family N-acetyltransferase n=1 Tax=Heyndrickxia oleronia TaxID=38875 RepID=UPI00203C1A55|nr:GNAT family N-acetyltransferase [Heyndrickxia oleronia]MCM3240025.1 GNAT family N-acetyltransferase [Heyndrickxia oleronia]